MAKKQKKLELDKKNKEDARSRFQLMLLAKPEEVPHQDNEKADPKTVIPYEQLPPAADLLAGSRRRCKGRKLKAKKGIKRLAHPPGSPKLTQVKEEADSPPPPSPGSPADLDILPEVDIPEARVDLRCSRCKKPFDMSRAQVVGNTFRCHMCNTRGVQLSRLPEWKASKLSGFTEEEKQDFWTRTHGCDSAAKLSLLVTNKVTHRHVETQHSEKLGTYLPLSVYKSKGYSIKRIKARCTDKKWHPVLGMCYRVVVESHATSADDQKAEEEELQQVQHPKGSAFGKGFPGTRDGQQLDPKQAKKDISTATKILAKLASIHAPLAALLKSKHVSKLPAFAIASAARCHEDLKSIDQNAQKVIKGVGELEYSIQQCNEVVKHATTQRDFVQSMLTAAAHMH